MSDAGGENKEPTMEEILASIRRIIDEDDESHPESSSSPNIELSEKGHQDPKAQSRSRKTRARTDKAFAILQNSPPLLKNDDPWGEGAQDAIGLDRQAAALAQMAVSCEMTPPLAVGVFGAWGSGKSFLMRLIHERVGSLSSSDDVRFHKRVVQIRFNAWHYVDTDLWASLAGQVFEQLEAFASSSESGNQTAKSVFGRLTTARELTVTALRDLALRRRAALSAQEAFQKAEERLEKVRSEFTKSVAGRVKAGARATLFGLQLWWSRDVVPRAAVQAIFGRPYAELVADWSSAREASVEIRREISVWDGTVKQIGNPLTLLLLTISLIGPAMIFAVASKIAFLRLLLANLEPTASIIVTFAVVSAGVFVRASRRVVIAREAIVEGVKKYRDSLEGALEEGTLASKEELARSQAEFVAAKSEVAQARNALESAIEAQADAARAYSGDTPAGRLRALLKDRAGSQSVYRSRQGLIGAIRRDFNDLAALMNPTADHAETTALRNAEETYRVQVQSLKDEFGICISDEELEAAKELAESPSAPIFTRIVLYIDDLDRCPAERVVEVLQAVHLLLAYSLFVVFVAVDIRWLSGSLQNIYPQLSSAESQDDAVALDYLEKIFQFPIWTPVFSREAAERLIAHQLDIGRSGAPGGQYMQRAEGNGGHAIGERRGELLSQASLTSFEAEWLRRVAPIAASSPRRLIRLVNTYRIARSSLEPAAARDLLEGGYRPFALLLALAAGFPSAFSKFAASLRDVRAQENLTPSWMAIADNDQLGPEKVAYALQLMRDEQMQPQYIARYLSLASRFSFAAAPPP